MAPTSVRSQPPTWGGFLVAGTDTGVGKTVVSCALLEIAARLGRPLIPFKPSESGCSNGRPQDAAALRSAAGRLDVALEKVCPFAFRPAVAPAAAARLMGQRLTLPKLLRAGRDLAQGQPMLIESAGGLLSPYSSTLTAADLAHALRLPILLIARNALGTINHTALALAEIRRRRLPLLGLILMTTRAERSLAQQQNPSLIEALTGVRPTATVPHFARATATRVRQHLDRGGVAERLLRRADLFRR